MSLIGQRNYYEKGLGTSGIGGGGKVTAIGLYFKRI